MGWATPWRLGGWATGWHVSGLQDEQPDRHNKNFSSNFSQQMHSEGIY